MGKDNIFGTPVLSVTQKKFNLKILLKLFNGSTIIINWVPLNSIILQNVSTKIAVAEEHLLRKGQQNFLFSNFSGDKLRYLNVFCKTKIGTM